MPSRTTVRFGPSIRPVLTPTPNDNPPPPPESGLALLGMRSPEAQFDARRAEVESAASPGRVECTRVFFGNGESWTDTGHRNFINRMLGLNILPIISFKPSGFTWGQYASGAADAQINSAVNWLADLPGEVYVAFHHEPFASGHPPASDGPGTTAEWVNANKRMLPMFASAGAHVKTCVIVNGWMWNSNSQGQSDAEIETVLPPSLRSLCDVVAADFYQNTVGAETAGSKMANFYAWAQRKGVTRGGAGEFSGQDYASMRSAPAEARAHRDFWAWLAVFNSDQGALGDYLQPGTPRFNAFADDLRTWRA